MLGACVLGKGYYYSAISANEGALQLLWDLCKGREKRGVCVFGMVILVCVHSEIVGCSPTFYPA